MRVRIRLFAVLRERAGTDSIELELPSGARVDDAIAAVRADGRLDPAVPVVLAVNREYADGATPLHAGDELALIPPVSGGSATQDHVWAAVSSAPLTLERVAGLVADPRAGAIVTFSGVTREIPSLEYEAYVEMAQERLAAVAVAAARRHGLCRVAVEHRIGVVALSEPSVVIAVSAAHRAEAFAGAREIIDVLKREVPIWKRELGEWVPGTVPGSGLDSLPGPGPASGSGESR